MEISEAIKKRRSVREYTSEDISEDLLREIIKAGTVAPSARNMQPWHFIIIRDNLIQKQLILDGSGREQLVKAPVVIAVCFDNKNEYGALDAALAAENIMIAAAGHGVGSCVVASYYQRQDKKDQYSKLKETIKLPENIDALLLMALGYSEEIPAERKLKPFEELIHFDRFGGLQYLKDEK